MGLRTMVWIQDLKLTRMFVPFINDWITRHNLHITFIHLQSVTALTSLPTLISPPQCHPQLMWFEASLA